MPHHPGEHTYNWSDLTGKEGVGLRVTGQAPSDRAGSRWHVVHGRCGHTEIIHGVHLRAMFKNQTKPRKCRVCFPKGARAGESL